MYLLYKPCEPGQLARHISHVHNQSHNKFYFTPVVLGSVQRLQGRLESGAALSSFAPITDMNINLLSQSKETI